MITLTTDFGLHDSYVAQLKGIIWGINPDVQIVDITHEVPPQNIIAASYIIDSVLTCFPKGTIHLLVVDPGVGTNRPVIATEIGNQFWISPDNGLLTIPLEKHKLTNTVHVTNSEYWRETVSQTFHGRDIMAPVAAHLSLGIPLSSLGDKIHKSPVILERKSPNQIANEIHGEVIWIDHFGNIITDISENLLDQKSCNQYGIFLNNHVVISGISNHYAQHPHGKLIALMGSFGLLEIAVNQGNAAADYHVAPGQKIIVKLKNE